MAEKQNYTDEMTNELVSTYQAAQDDSERMAVVNNYSVKFGKPKRSIISKLSKEKVYIKPERASKNGGIVIKKEDLETRIIAEAEQIGMNGSHFEGISKAPKNVGLRVLELLLMVQNLEEIEEESENESEAA